ncbi:MAG: hypothetical protein ACXVDD_23375, partial [Polyangia bacterium]
MLRLLLASLLVLTTSFARAAEGEPHDAGWDPAWNQSLPQSQNALLTAIAFCNGRTGTWTDAPGTNENLPM